RSDIRPVSRFAARCRPRNAAAPATGSTRTARQEPRGSQTDRLARLRRLRGSGFATTIAAQERSMADKPRSEKMRAAEHCLEPLRLLSPVSTRSRASPGSTAPAIEISNGGQSIDAATSPRPAGPSHLDNKAEFKKPSARMLELMRKVLIVCDLIVCDFKKRLASTIFVQPRPVKVTRVDDWQLSEVLAGDDQALKKSATQSATNPASSKLSCGPIG